MTPVAKIAPRLEDDKRYSLPTLLGCTWGTLCESLAMITFGLDFKDLDNECQEIIKQISYKSLTDYRKVIKSCHSYGVYGMSEESKETAQKMIQLTEARIQKLTVEYEKTVLTLRENIHQMKITAGMIPDDSPSFPANSEVIAMLRKTRHEAAEWALRKIGKAVDLHDITEYLSERGYSPESDLKTLENSLYVSMNRKPSTFKHYGTGEWALVEWKGKKAPANLETE